MATRYQAIALALFAGAILQAACAGGGTKQTQTSCPAKTPVVYEDGAPLTVDELIGRVSEAVTCPGYALHLTSIALVDYEPASFTVEWEGWLDLANNQGRAETAFTNVRENNEDAQPTIEPGTAELPRETTTTILRGDGKYELEDDDERADRGSPPDCHGDRRVALDLLVTCLYFRHDFDKTVDLDASYEDTDAVALETHGTLSGSDETSDITYRTFFDASYLPVGAVIESAIVTSGDALESPVSFSMPYQTEFVALESLPADFFEPTSIGYVEEPRTDPFAAKDYGVDVYWLGMDFPGGEGFPALAYDSLSASPPGTPDFDYYKAEVYYRPLDDEFGPKVVSLMLSTRKEWDAFIAQSRSGNWWDGPCVQRREIELLDGSAILYAGLEFPERAAEGACPPADKFLAHVFIGDTVIKIAAPGLIRQGEGLINSPYNSEAAIEFLIRSLEPRKQ